MYFYSKKLLKFCKQLIMISKHYIQKRFKLVYHTKLSKIGEGQYKNDLL